MTGSELQLSSARYTSSSLLPYTAGLLVKDGDTPWNTYGQMVWSGSALSRDFVSGTYHIWKNEAEVMWFSSYNHDCLSLTVAVLYYYHYKRSVLRISDPRFYQDFNWVNHQHDGSWDPNLRYTYTHICIYVCVYRLVWIISHQEPGFLPCVSAWNREFMNSYLSEEVL